LPGALLDTHTLYWLVTAAGDLSEEALLAIAANQTAATLHVSPITAWELAIASKKPPHKDPPNLGALTPAKWFSKHWSSGDTDQAKDRVRGSFGARRHRP
jgi:PIN domain nuclease of toxin-antitoxin system